MRKQPAVDAPVTELIAFAKETQRLIGTKDSDVKRFNNGLICEEYISANIERASRAVVGVVRQIDAIDSQESRDFIIDYIAPRTNILVFHGKCDELVPTENAYHFHRLIKNSMNRAAYPPSSQDKNDKNNDKNNEIKQLDEIKQVIDERCEVTTIPGHVLPDGRQNFTTLAMLSDQAHELSDDFCSFLAPQLLVHLETAQGKVDVNLPRTFPKVEFGKEPSMSYNCLNVVEEKEIDVVVEEKEVVASPVDQVTKVEKNDPENVDLPADMSNNTNNDDDVEVKSDNEQQNSPVSAIVNAD